MADRRRAAATAGVGYSLVGAGGVLRGHAIDAAHGAIGRDTRRMVPPSRAVLRTRQLRLPAARTLTRRWGVGTALVTLGAPAAAEGTLDLVRHRRTTTAKRHSLLGEGVAGTGDAWKDKAEGFTSGAPARIRAIPIAVGAAAGAGGSVAAHRALDLIARRRRVSGRLRSGLTAVAAVPAVVGSLPLSRRLTRRAGYEPQAAGGLRRIDKAAGTVYRGPDYLGRHVSPRQQRLRVYAAGGTPVVGPLAQARQAGKYAPPGHRNSAIARQLVGGPGVGLAGGVGGAYALAHAAEYSPTIARHTERAAQAGADAKTKMFGAVGIRRASKAPGEVPAVLRRVASTKLGAPLFSSRRRAIGTAVGYVAGKTIAGQVGGNVAINRNIAAQRRYDSHRMRTPMAKAQAGLTDRQAHTLARRKHRSAVMSVIGGTAGLSALGLHGARRLPRYRGSEAKLVRWRESALVVGAGIGGANALTNAAIQRRESRAITAAVAKTWWAKRANTPVRTTLTDTEAHKLVHGRGGYGLTGPLPGHLDRPARMQAYEARYLAAGGRKAEHWQHRAQHAEVARNVGLASATGAGAAWLAASSPRVRRAVSPLSRLARRRGPTEHRVKHAAERLAVAGGTLGGAAELSEEYARHRRGSYASAPAGVAASALRRMQSYSPQ